MNYKKIRKLNDSFRSSIKGRDILIPFRTEDHIHRGFTELVKKYKDFSGKPDDEHNFGKMVTEVGTYYWVIGYYNPERGGPSEDPSDPTKTGRVLRIIHESEFTPPLPSS